MNPLMPQPSFKIPLFEHQLKSVSAMIQVEANAGAWHLAANNAENSFRIGLNANVAGFGKTLEMLALLSHAKARRLASPSPSALTDGQHSTFSAQRSHMSDLAMSRKRVVYARKVDCAIVLVSPSIVGQWVAELAATDLTSRLVVTKKHVEDLDVLLKSAPEQIEDVLLCVPTMWNLLVEHTRQTAFSRFIFDEPGHVRFAAMATPKADFTWLMTATPIDLRTSPVNRGTHFLNGLRTVEHSVFQDWLARASVRNTIEDVELSVRLPPMVEVRHQCASGITRLLQGFVAQHVFEMIQAGDVEGAAASLGSTTSMNLIVIVRKQMQDRLSLMVQRLNSHRGIDGDAAVRLRLVADHDRAVVMLATLEARVAEMLNGDCIICQDKLQNPVMEPSCQNVFCASCILNWINVYGTERESRCPTCRVPCGPRDLIFLAPERAPVDEPARPYSEAWIAQRASLRVVSRSETVTRIVLATHAGARVLVFSTQYRSFDAIVPNLATAGIACAILKGSAAARTNMIQRYNAGTTRVLCLNSMSDGAGLNLPLTDHIVLIHEMARYREQVVARAQRIGRTGPLHVHELVVE